MILKLGAPRSPRSSTVYACDTCGTRSLGQQRCEEFGTFMRRLGPGGQCPNCEEALGITDLVDEEVMRGLS